jgi:hypothetical protein
MIANKIHHEADMKYLSAPRRDAEPVGGGFARRRVAFVGYRWHPHSRPDSVTRRQRRTSCTAR